MNAGVQSTFRALGDPTRRMILVHLSEGDMTIGKIAERFDVTRAAIKKHLTILEEGRLISVHPRGRERINRLEPHGLMLAADWINTFSHFWDERLAKLQTAIERQANDRRSNRKN